MNSRQSYSSPTRVLWDHAVCALEEFSERECSQVNHLPALSLTEQERALARETSLQTQLPLCLANRFNEVQSLCGISTKMIPLAFDHFSAPASISNSKRFARSLNANYNASPDPCRSTSTSLPTIRMSTLTARFVYMDASGHPTAASRDPASRAACLKYYY